jgi:hypothetical protein
MLGLEMGRADVEEGVACAVPLLEDCAMTVTENKKATKSVTKLDIL